MGVDRVIVNDTAGYSKIAVILNEDGIMLGFARGDGCIEEHVLFIERDGALPKVTVAGSTTAEVEVT